MSYIVGVTSAIFKKKSPSMNVRYSGQYDAWVYHSQRCSIEGFIVYTSS